MKSGDADEETNDSKPKESEAEKETSDAKGEQKWHFQPI